MSTVKKRVSFLDTEEGKLVVETLQHMANDAHYSTNDSYSADTVQHPTNMVSFVDKHIRYLNAHPAVDASHYLSNLRLITRIR